jgi:hypothetical protein
MPWNAAETMGYPMVWKTSPCVAFTGKIWSKVKFISWSFSRSGSRTEMACWSRERMKVEGGYFYW